MQLLKTIQLLEISLEYRVIFGISGMVLLFAGFLVVFVTGQRRKLQYHKELHALHEEQQRHLTQQNLLLEERVEERTTELSFQKNELQRSLQELHRTQLQLIQKEKMASLGELTAGIAHEIQNPLNFVNNFSDVSIELVDELHTELKNNEPEEALAIADDIKQLLEKINHHGKRAGTIIRGMLEHARIDSGQRETMDINKLLSGSLSLSYQGFCANHLGFTAACETMLDENTGEMPVLVQALERVFFNLFNNAFYAVLEKTKLAEKNFAPAISVTTQKLGDNIKISVTDNGIGIPAKNIKKIFQPFFTTKPAGEGTGLGLSLSYDIIKAHGGELEVTSVEGEYAIFVVWLVV